MRWLAKIHDNFDVSVPSIAHSDEYITDILEFLNTGTDKLPFVMLLTIAAANYESSESKGARELRRFGDELKRRATEYALIMKGGGVKGLAYVGALRELSTIQKPFHFSWFVGTSAGAIAAVLLAAGYQVEELETILREKDFAGFLDANPIQAASNLIFHGGLYKADTLVQWIDDLLSAKVESIGRVKLRDLPYRVTIYATKRGADALIFDSCDSRTQDEDAAYAVRCSMSVPFFFTPQHKSGLRVFDGGVRHNYPVEKLLKDYPDQDFIGLYLGPKPNEAQRQEGWIQDLISIVTEASDVDSLRKHRRRTIIIDPRPISTLAFRLDKESKNFLVDVGRVSTQRFLLEHGYSNNKPEIEAASQEIETRRVQLDKTMRTRMIRSLALRVLVMAIAIIAVIFGIRMYSNYTLLSPPAQPVAGQEWRNPKDSAIYLYIPSGPYSIASRGSGEEAIIEIEDGYWIKKEEVTNAQYKKCFDERVCSTPSENGDWDSLGKKNHPVSNISYASAETYAKWVGGALPSGDEWEIACAGAERRLYPWGESTPSPALANINRPEMTSMEVGLFPAGVSPFGALDMAGNVWEITPDRHESGDIIIRGGGFNLQQQGEINAYLMCSAKLGRWPDRLFDSVGFRVVIPTGRR